MINELVGSPTRSDYVYFANNEQESIAVFTAVFCFVHAEHHFEAFAKIFLLTWKNAVHGRPSTKWTS